MKLKRFKIMLFYNLNQKMVIIIVTVGENKQLLRIYYSTQEIRLSLLYHAPYQSINRH
jgi:hypothetical protein